jgi:hypothetical protein
LSIHDYLKTATTWQRAWMAQMQMLTTAAMVIQSRVLQMSLGTMRPEEATRMFLEKPAAFAKSHEMAMRAAASNKGHAAVALAAIGPIGKTTQANARRLSKASGMSGGRGLRRR